MGKYDSLKTSIPSLKEEPDYQEKVDIVKTAMASDPNFAGSAAALAAAYVRLRDEKDAINAQLSEINIQLTAVSQLLVNRYEADGTTSLRLSSGELVRVQDEPTAKVADKEAFRLWCIANGYERQLQLWPSTTTAITKERLLDGMPEPDGVQAFMKHTIFVKKEK